MNYFCPNITNSFNFEKKLQKHSKLKTTAYKIVTYSEYFQIKNFKTSTFSFTHNLVQ